jgi:thiol-disulfide isomerase/thioredoxin
VKRASVIRSVVSAAFVILALAGCSSSTGLDTGASNSNYIDDSGQPVLVKPADRAAPLEFTGKTEDGSPLTVSTYRGKVVVVNFWYSSCAPCRAEAPILQGLSDQYQDDGVSFIGVNTIDQPDTAIAFERSHKVTYPSVLDVDSGSARIAFHGAISANTVPVTFVLDTKGRVAARIVGELQSPSILNTLITQTLAEAK